MTDTLLLFNEAVSKYPLYTIAEKLGLNINTVKRWVAKNSVPNNYLADFSRLLGKPQYSDNIRGKDQFYTKPEISKKCFEIFLKVAKELDICIDEYTFVEPSAGDGGFYSLLPKDKRIGVDIDPQHKNLIKQDYLLWRPENDCKYIVIGNPPFGLRGHLALQFINHSSDFADIVAFILPPLFNSDGKGVPAKRVKDYTMAYTANLPTDSFVYPNGDSVDVSVIFQVWTKVKTENINIQKPKTCKEYIKVYSLSDGGTPSSTRNKNMLYECDVYLPSTCFSGMDFYNDFESLPHRRGYGVKILQDKSTIKKSLESIAWSDVAFRSTNGALNLRTSLIEEALIHKSGYYDKHQQQELCYE